MSKTAKGNAVRRNKSGAIPQQQFNDSVFRSLLEVSRNYQAVMMRLLQNEYGHGSLKLTFEGVMRSVPREGIRHGDLARKLGRKKQNIGPLIKAVEKGGYIRVAEDRDDKRAKCVWLTDAGVQLIAEGVEVTERINEVIGRLLGSEAFSLLKQTLQNLNVGVSPEATHTAVESPAGFIANLIQLSDYSSNRLYQYLREHNHKSFKPAHGNIFVYFGYENPRITSIAKARDVSKQAIAKLVYEMEEEGYLTTMPDPQDKRGKIIRLTARGMDLINTSENAAELLASEFAFKLGGSCFEQFQQTLSELHHRFYQLERSLFSGSSDALIDVNGHEQAGRMVIKKLLELESSSEGYYQNLLETVVVNGSKKLKISADLLDALSRINITKP